MNSLIIKQNSTETVSSDTVHKLYLQVYSSSLHDISGELNVNKCYQSEVEYLRANCTDLTINVTSGYYIPFVDDAVRTALATQIGDGTGVTQDLLSGITYGNSSLLGNSSIVNFPEYHLVGTHMDLSRCSNLETLSIGTGTCTTYLNNDYYYNCTKLKNFIIHDMINWYNFGTSHRHGARSAMTDVCSSDHLYFDENGNHITNLVLPEGCTGRDNNTSRAFVRGDFSTATLPSTIEYLHGFASCKSLTTVDFTSATGLKKIMDNCFDGCNNLVLDLGDIPQTVTSIGLSAFEECHKFTGTLDLPNLTNLGYRFIHWTSTSGVIGLRNLGSITTFPGFNWYNNGSSSFKFVVLPTTLTTCNHLPKCTQYIKCLATNPPTVSVQCGLTPVYVPHDSLSTYQSDSNWSTCNLQDLNNFAADKIANNWDE